MIGLCFCFILGQELCCGVVDILVFVCFCSIEIAEFVISRNGQIKLEKCGACSDIVISLGGLENAYKWDSFLQMITEFGNCLVPFGRNFG